MKPRTLVIIRLIILTGLLVLWGPGWIAAQDTERERLAVEENKSSTFNTEILRLRTDMDTNSRDLATMKGEGIGAVTLLGLLDAVQLLLIGRKPR